jgi:hypothetical protein
MRVGERLLTATVVNRIGDGPSDRITMEALGEDVGFLPDRFGTVALD